MAAVTSVMRAQQLLLSRVEDTLKPYGLTFAAYEALRLLAFSRRGSLPMGKMGERLMVHPASVTNAITRLEQRGLVERRLSPDDRRVVLATITPAGQALVREATEALNQASFGLPSLTAGQAAELTSTLRALRVAGGDAAAGARMPAAVTADREAADQAGDPDRHRPLAGLSPAIFRECGSRGIHRWAQLPPLGSAGRARGDRRGILLGEGRYRVVPDRGPELIALGRVEIETTRSAVRGRRHEGAGGAA